MNEQEWLACTNPSPMLEHLRAKASDRKLRVFAVVCCQRIRHLMSDDNSERYEVAELVADGTGSTSELLSARSVGQRLTSYTINNFPLAWTAENYADAAAGDAAHTDPYFAACSVCELAQLAQNPVENEYGNADVGEEHHAQAALLRDIFGNPFRPVSLDPSWLTTTVLALAQQMYESRDFSTMPILADALQDAECDNAEILDHCRSGGSHVRGCWLIDLMLGKS